MSVGTLRAMAQGGIYDQVGGGFARYAVDATWTIPHFEKMLYDQAGLARVYARAYAAWGLALISAFVGQSAADALSSTTAPARVCANWGL